VVTDLGVDRRRESDIDDVDVSWPEDVCEALRFAAAPGR
jgi:hypothetical protein